MECPLPTAEAGCLHWGEDSSMGATSGELSMGDQREYEIAEQIKQRMKSNCIVVL